MSWQLIPEVALNGAFWLWLVAVIPAAVVCVLKERWLIFAAGWLTLGIAWFFGAIALADPDSGWARRFYGEEKLARTGDPIRYPRPPRTTALWAGGAVALLLAIGLMTARPTPVIGVDGRALRYSVGGGIGLATKDCERQNGGSWRCQAYDNGFSGMVPYEVRVGRLGCWTAVRSGWSAEGAPKHLSGCLTVWDQIRLVNLVL